jgi:copper chaperone CopZ
MICNHCIKSLTEGLTSFKGVRHVTVSLEARQVDVVYDENLMDLEKLHANVAEIGYRAS